jgi:hypothetical protein
VYEFRRFNGFSRSLFEVSAVETDTFVTNTYISWTLCELIGLIVLFLTERTLIRNVLLLLAAFPHTYSPYTLN